MRPGRWGRGIADGTKAGTKGRVAELMAEDCKPAQIAPRLGVSIYTVYAYVAAIKRDLGPQARAIDLGWRGGTVWHVGRA